MFVTNMDEDGAEIPLNQTIRDPNSAAENTVEESKDAPLSQKAVTPKPDHEELKEKEERRGVHRSQTIKIVKVPKRLLRRPRLLHSHKSTK